MKFTKKSLDSYVRIRDAQTFVEWANSKYSDLTENGIIMATCDFIGKYGFLSKSVNCIYIAEDDFKPCLWAEMTFDFYGEIYVVSYNYTAYIEEGRRRGHIRKYDHYTQEIYND